VIRRELMPSTEITSYKLTFTGLIPPWNPDSLGYPTIRELSCRGSNRDAEYGYVVARLCGRI